MRICPGASPSCWLPFLLRSHGLTTASPRRFQETLKEKLERLADPYETNLYVKK